MGLDFRDFGLGLAAGWITAYGVYRARHLIGATTQTVSRSASSAQNYATQSTDTRYVNDMVKVAQSAHLAGKLVKLTEVLVEPRFIVPPPLVTPPEDEVTHQVFHIVPNIPDLPYLQAPYNVETISIDDLGTGDRKLALLGNSGSGRTTALMAILLRSFGELRIKRPIDKIQQQMDSEEAALDEKQRAARIKERVTLEQRARERLAEEKGMAFEDGGSETSVPLLNRLMPVYVHLSDVLASAGILGQEVDPAEPLVHSVQQQLGRIAASTIPASLYRRLKKGQTLILVDGYDDLPESQREVAIEWLDILMSEYNENFYIVTGPTIGYGDLTRRLGFTPIFLRPWSNRDVTQAIDNWSETWPIVSGDKRNPGARPPDATVNQIKADNRRLSPLELTLKILRGFANNGEPAHLEDWLRAYLTRHLNPDQVFETVMPQIIQIAVLQLEDGGITLSRLIELTGKTEQNDSTPTSEGIPPQEKLKSTKKEASPQAKLLEGLHRSGLLVQRLGGGYQFRHPVLAWYVASLSLHEVSDEELVQRISLNGWRGTIPYLAMSRPVDEIVKARMTASPDLVQSGVFEAANWLRYRRGEADWRMSYLLNLSNMLVAVNQYPHLRERAAAALVATGDPAALSTFQQATKSILPHIRMLACLGLGAMGETETIKDLIPLLNDSDNNVQTAAALALGVIPTEESLTALVEAFTEGSEQLRQAASESFADIPAEGHPILRDAIEDEDMLVRRAAVFGLRRIPSTWAFISVYRAFLEDKQWYVRSAAQLVYEEIQNRNSRGPKGYPPTEAIVWLNEWAAQRGENVSTGEEANDMLAKALQDNNPHIRTYAAADIGQLGVASMTPALYIALRDRQEEVRSAAYHALADLQSQIGEPFPAPV